MKNIKFKIGEVEYDFAQIDGFEMPKETTKTVKEKMEKVVKNSVDKLIKKSIIKSSKLTK